MALVDRGRQGAYFYLTDADTMASQWPKGVSVLRGTGAIREASFVSEDGTPLNDRLVGLSFGSTTEYRRWRGVHDIANARYAIQYNTGTDSATNWVDKLYVDTNGNITWAGNFTSQGTGISRVYGSTSFNNNIDMNGFYIRNLGGLNDIRFTQAGRQYTTTFTNQTSVTVNHNLNTLFPVVVVYQTSDSKLIVPENVAVNSANQITVTFGEGTRSGTILVTGSVGGVGINFTDGAETISYSAQLNVNPNDFYLTKTGDGNGYAVLNAQGDIPRKRTINFGSAVEWQATHNLGTSELVYSVYDNRQIAINPSKVDVSNPNTAFFYFQTAKSGRVVVIG